MTAFPFAGRRVTNSASRQKPGDFWFVVNGQEKIVGMGFDCPCGCGERGMVLFYKLDNHDAWKWDGNEDKPTLTPSIQRNTSCRWHGFMTKGMWTL
jgi:hypothetical protein